MKDNLSGLLPMALLVAAMSLPSSEATAANGSLCDYSSATFAALNPNHFAGCVQLRTAGAAAKGSPVVWSLTDDSVFATTCPVKIVLPDPHITGCTSVAIEALKPGDDVRVDEWGTDKLELLILRDGRSVFHPTQPRVFLKPAQVKLDDDLHTIGYFADALVYPAKAGDKAVPVTYYVYLGDIVQNGKTIRWYQIEVFDETAECRKEVPGHPAAQTAVVACDKGEQKARVRLRGAAQPMEMPYGGGGEPPPTPPG